MSVKQLLLLESETITDKAIKIPFDFSNKECIPKGKSVGDNIIISPITVRTWFKIKPLILSIDSDDFDKLIDKEEKTPDAELTKLISKYDDVLFDIICLGIHNKKSDPPLWFRDVLKDNCTWMDVFILLNAVLFRIGYNSFCNSITILKSVSPMTKTEIIAAQKNLKSWTSQSVLQCS